MIAAVGGEEASIVVQSSAVQTAQSYGGLIASLDRATRAADGWASDNASAKFVEWARNVRDVRDAKPALVAVGERLKLFRRSQNAAATSLRRRCNIRPLLDLFLIGIIIET